jgi:hypothetical protein
MKIQCACGTKVAFDVSPEMARTRVQFVCPNCGQDSSDLVNELIRREIASGPATPPPVEIAPPPSAEAGGAPPAPPARPRVVIATPRPIMPASAPGPVVATPPPAVSTRTATNAGVRVGDNARTAATSKFCSKHPGVRTTHECLVCHKPICPKCMQLFGYVCSPLCKEKAELQGIKIPVYAGRKDLVAQGEWRHTKRVFLSVTAVVVTVLGVWFWWSWIATAPRTAFSLRFDRAAYSGACKLAPDNQLFFLHGLTLARYDVKARKDIWSFDIMTREQITNVATIVYEQMVETLNKAVAQGEEAWNIPAQDELVSEIADGQAEGLGLHIVGKNIWVSSFGRLTRYDFDTGKAAQSFLFSENARVRPRGDEFLAITDDLKNGKETVIHVNLASGETNDETLPIEVDPDAEPGMLVRGVQKGGTEDLNPEEIAAQYTHMSVPAKIALPATLSIARNQEAALKEMRDDDQGNRPKRQRKKITTINVDRFQTILTSNGAVQVSERLLKENFTEHVAMKDPPKKSIIDGNLTAANSMEASGEILNEMRRDSGGGTEEEDDGSYQIIIRRIDATDAPDWREETVGPPRYFPLKTVDVVAGNRSLTVIDKNNKEMWKADLTFMIPGGGIDYMEDGPADLGDTSSCVEHEGGLYVFDQGMLTAFDLATGNVRWRVPSVGIYGLHFNDDGMLYVSTTTAGPDTIKYSHQIDLTSKIDDVLMKIDPKDGKILWDVQPGGHVAYVSGKYIYTLASYRPYEDDHHPFETTTGFETLPYTTVKRVDPKNGKELWEYDEKRGPLDVQFEKNTIELVFKKEVMVLKYLTF